MSASTLRKLAEEEAKKKAKAEEAKRKEEEKKAQELKRAAEEERKKCVAELKDLEMERWNNARAPSVSRHQTLQHKTESTVLTRPSSEDLYDEIPAEHADLEPQIDIERELCRKFETIDDQQRTDVEDADVAVPRYLKQLDKTMPQFELWVAPCMM